MNISSQRSAGARPSIGRSLWWVAVPLFTLVIGGVVLVLSGDITGREGTYPRVLALVVVVLALVSIRSDYVAARRDAAAPAAPAAPVAAGAVAPVGQGDDVALLHEEGGEDYEDSRGEGVAGRRVLLLIAVTGLSIYLMTWVGFFIPAVLLIGGGLVVLGEHSWWKVLAYTAGLVAAAHLLFVEALGVPFPPAPWS